MNIIHVAVVVFLLLVSSENAVLAIVGHRATPSSPTQARAIGEPRGDWYNEIGYPQQFFRAQLTWFKIGFYYMLVFLKIFLLMGIWPEFRDKEEDVSPYNCEGCGQNKVYYSSGSWPSYG
ncbi:uncharacterized protein LOC134214165 [Armigeres subalbatus]|uniref:uncharacterized protein LOC134214165 n=1 Tax=Armigeres subalbatus TaxID=124917 RepID=UPI002ED0F338